MTDRLTMTGLQIEESLEWAGERGERLLREAKAEEREQCCKDVCMWCEGDLPAREAITAKAGAWVHRYPDTGNKHYCDAHAIRERAYQQEQEGK